MTSPPDQLRGQGGHTLLEFLEDPVAVVSRSGRVVYLNPAFEIRFQTSRATAFGRPFGEILPEWLARPLQEQVQGLKPPGTSRHFWIKSSRESFRASLTGIVLKGKIGGAVISLWDATREIREKQRNFDLFRLMLEDLEYPAQEISALFQNPSASRETILRSARSQSEQLTEALQRFKDFGNLLFGEIQTESIPFFPNRLLTLSRKSLQPLAQEKGVFLEDGSARECPRLLGDPALLNRVLGLTVDYMIRSVPRGELVVLSAEIHLLHETPYLSYSITGTGVLGLETEWIFRDQAWGGTSSLSPTSKNGSSSALCSLIVLSAHSPETSRSPPTNKSAPLSPSASPLRSPSANSRRRSAVPGPETDPAGFTNQPGPREKNCCR